MILSRKYNISMASKRKAASTSTYSTADDANDIEFGLSVTEGLAPLPTSTQLNTSASTLKDATADNTDNDDFALSITRGLRPLRRSKRFKKSSLALPVAVSLTEHTSDPKLSSERYDQKRMRLLELPLDVLCLVADHLDAVARACLRYAHPALGRWSKKDPDNLSACAKSRIVSLLQRDGVSIPKELLGVPKKGTSEGECSEYDDVAAKYCVICRCYGHLSHCPGCRVRTCAREGTYISELIFPNGGQLESQDMSRVQRTFSLSRPVLQLQFLPCIGFADSEICVDTEFWRKWTGIVDCDTAFIAGIMH